MSKLKIMSMNFTPNFFLSKQILPGENEKMMKISSSYLREDGPYDIILLQGKDAMARGKSLVKNDSYRIFSNSDSSTAILTSRKLQVLYCPEVQQLGNIVVVQNIERRLALASVSLTRKKDLGVFKEQWNKFIDSNHVAYTDDQVIGGLFPSKEAITTFAVENGLLDTSLYIQSTCKELENDSYSILTSDNFELVDQPHRQTGLVKEKYLKHCPIGISVQNKTR